MLLFALPWVTLSHPYHYQPEVRFLPVPANKSRYSRRAGVSCSLTPVCLILQTAEYVHSVYIHNKPFITSSRAGAALWAKDCFSSSLPLCLLALSWWRLLTSPRPWFQTLPVKSAVLLVFLSSCKCQPRSACFDLNIRLFDSKSSD